MNEQELQSEVLSADETKLREMCGNLKRFSAPNNFEMRVKARIAAHQPQSATPPFFGFLKVAAPLGLAVAFLGTVVSYNIFSANENLSSQIAASEMKIQKPQTDFSSQSVNSENLIAKNSGPNANFDTDAPKTVNVNIDQSLAMNDKNNLGRMLESPKINQANTNGGSRDSASTQSRVITPRGFPNNNFSSATPVNTVDTNSSNIAQILSIIGIKGVSAGNAWRVQSVSKDSKADRSEIQPNDLIEAIDGIKLSDIKNLQINNGTKLTVVREGNRIEITMK